MLERGKNYKKFKRGRQVLETHIIRMKKHPNVSHKKPRANWFMISGSKIDSSNCQSKINYLSYHGISLFIILDVGHNSNGIRGSRFKVASSFINVPWPIRSAKGSRSWAALKVDYIRPSSVYPYPRVFRARSEVETAFFFIPTAY